MPTPTPRERLLAAYRREPVEGGPAGWAMRQAGRYLPEYRALRRGRSFWEAMSDPEVATDITCQPLRRFDMDAAIVFCDILVPLAALGSTVDYVEGKGPVVTPAVRSARDLERLGELDPERDAGFLSETLRAVRAEIGEEKALLGFCGAPFTTSSYLIEGGTSRNFEHAKGMLHGAPELFERVLAKLVDASLPYLELQVAAGADALQIFDSWGGALDAATWRRAVLPQTRRLVQGARAFGVPVIFYVNGAAHLLEAMVDTGADVLGVDHRVDPTDAIRRVGDRVALQGNLDPCILFAPPEVVEAETTRVLDAFEPQRGYAFNLGTGILPKTPVESVEAAFRTLLARRATSGVGG